MTVFFNLPLGLELDHFALEPPALALLGAALLGFGLLRFRIGKVA